MSKRTVEQVLLDEQKVLKVEVDVLEQRHVAARQRLDEMAKRVEAIEDAIDAARERLRAVETAMNALHLTKVEPLP